MSLIAGVIRESAYFSRLKVFLPLMSRVGYPSLRPESGSGRDDSNSERSRIELSHYPTRYGGRMRTNRVYLRYLTSKTKPI